MPNSHKHNINYLKPVKKKILSLTLGLGSNDKWYSVLSIPEYDFLLHVLKHFNH